MPLGLKLFIALTLVLFIGLGFSTLLHIKSHTDDLLELVQINALQATDLIKESTHHSMLINRKEDISQTFKNFGELPEFEAIRIYDKRGYVIFSTKPNEKFNKVPIASEDCQVCHRYEQPLTALASKQRHRIIKSPDGHRILALINPIENEESCYGTDCHEHPNEKSLLGVLDVQMSLATVDADIERSHRQTMLVFAILITSIFLVIGILIWNLILAPVGKLIEGTKAVAQGNLDYTIPLEKNDEIGKLANSFNSMTKGLKKAQGEISQWSETLQKRVDEKTEELKRIQSHLIQVEKMASLGKLSATVAHELNNPLEGILTYSKLLQLKLKSGNFTEEKLASIQEELSIISEEALRCGNIVNNLLLFSKRQIAEFAGNDLHEILDRCTQLVMHHLTLHKIQLNKTFNSQHPNIICDKNQIQQAFLALLMNAVEAMPDEGTLTITTEDNLEEETITIVIQDTGAGISKEAISHIFEPFFTTKEEEEEEEEEGKGVGLGLSVVYGIMEAHNGEINVTSIVGEGSKFIIKLHRQLDNKTEPFMEPRKDFKVN